MKNPIQTTTIHKLGLCSLILVGCSPSGSTMSMMEENDGQAISKGQDISLFDALQKLPPSKVCEETLNSYAIFSQGLKMICALNDGSIKILHSKLLTDYTAVETLAEEVKKRLPSMDNIEIKKIQNNLTEYNDSAFNEFDKKIVETCVYIGDLSNFQERIDTQIRAQDEQALTNIKDPKGSELFKHGVRTLIIEQLTKLEKQCEDFKTKIEEYKPTTGYKVFEEVIDHNLMIRLDEFAKIVKEINYTIGNLVIKTPHNDSLSTIINCVIKQFHDGLLSLVNSGNDISLDVNLLALSSDKTLNTLIHFFTKEVRSLHIGQMWIRVGRILFLLESITGISLDIEYTKYASKIINDHGLHLYDKMNKDKWQLSVAL